MTNAEIFRKAADDIRENGWGRGYLSAYEAPHCIRGALRAVVGDDRDLYLDLTGIIAERVGTMLFGSEWNDVPERTAEEVVALLDGLAFDEDLKAAATADNPARRVMATSNPVEQSHDSAIIPSLEAVPANA